MCANMAMLRRLLTIKTTARWVHRIQCRGLLTRAYDTGPTEPPLLGDTVPQHFAGIVRQYGDRDA